LKITNTKRAGGMSKVVKCLPSKHEALSSKKKKEKEKKKSYRAVNRDSLIWRNIKYNARFRIMQLLNENPIKYRNRSSERNTGQMLR
jgi:hypothetical protein